MKAKITQMFAVVANPKRNFHCTKEIEILFIPALGITLILASGEKNRITGTVATVFVRPDGTDLSIYFDTLDIDHDTDPKLVSDFMVKNGFVSNLDVPPPVVSTPAAAPSKAST